MRIPQTKQEMTKEEKADIALLRKKQKQRGLTKETHEAVLFTTKSTVDSVRFLITVYGFAFVLTRRFSSDDIEQLFGTVRQMVGGNFKLDARSWTYSFEKILRTGIAFANIDGNVRLTPETHAQYQLIRENLSSRTLAGNELMFLPSSYLLVLGELLEAPG
jgi:hypothetical protein